MHPSVITIAGVSAGPQLLPLEEDLRRCRREQQEAQQRGRQLEQKMEELEERSAAAVGDRERQVKLMEVKKTTKQQLLDGRQMFCFCLFFFIVGGFKNKK